MDYHKWLNQIPKEITNDVVWNSKVYRAALFASDLCWKDTNEIREERLFSLADQLF